MIKFINSNIGLKLLMAFTGLGMALFLVAHVAGNLLIIIDEEAFNLYAHTLTSNKPLLFTAEAGLVGIFLAHVYAAVTLTMRNRRARNEAYIFKKNTGESRRNWFSSNMLITGLFIVVFLVAHLLDFKWGEHQSTLQGGVEMRDLAWNVKASFAKPLEVLFYIFALVVIFGHLFHGFRSAWASMGAEHKRTKKYIKLVSRVFVFGIGGGFLLIPVWIFVSSNF